MLRPEVGDIVRLTEEWAAELEGGSAAQSFKPYIRHLFFVVKYAEHTPDTTVLIRPVTGGREFLFGIRYLEPLKP